MERQTPRFISHRHCAGLALVDVLVATVLLAIALAGACTTLIQAVRASRAALLATRAVDLASDLSERLQGVASVAQAQAAMEAWRASIPDSLPVRGLEPAEVATLTWVPAAAAPAAGQAVTPHLLLRLVWHGDAAGSTQLSVPIAYQGEAP